MAAYGRRIWPLTATESMSIRFEPGDRFKVLDAAGYLRMHPGSFVAAVAAREAEIVLGRRCRERELEEAERLEREE